MGLDDRCGLTRKEFDEPVIWLLWHNRVFLIPYMQNRKAPHRHGKALTSPSGDGEIIARVMERFGHGAIRGSSNKRPAAAMREMTRALRDGYDLAITPDGPRGPRYQMQLGAVKLAQISGAAIMPIHVRYSRAWVCRTWDKFLIPKPFAAVNFVFDELVYVPRDASEESLERIRRELEKKMGDAAKGEGFESPASS